MSVNDIAKLEKLLAQHSSHFACRFARGTERGLLAVNVQGLGSDVQRKNVEAMAQARNVVP
jgi:hypothetical protein